MKKTFLASLILCLASMNCLSKPENSDKPAFYEITLFDAKRKRAVPMAFWEGKNASKGVVIFSHGYSNNAQGSYKTYSYLTEALAMDGYHVVSLQHDLPSDELLAMDGDLYKLRMPSWEKGAQNILFAINALKQIRDDLNWNNAIAIGHSNGGDMTMLFAAKHPGLIKKAISLDNRRMPLPRTSSPAVMSLRAFDVEANPGVLPTPDEAGKNAIKIVRFDDIRHGDMDDKGEKWQHEKILNEVFEFLN